MIILKNAILDKHALIVTNSVKRDRQPGWYNAEINLIRSMRGEYCKWYVD